MIHALISGLHGSEAEVEAVVDTGFTGFLTLAPAMIEHLALVSSGSRNAALADGSVADLASHDAEVVWHGNEVPVEVLAISGTPLVGMELLRGSEPRVRAVPDGRVAIEELV